MNYKSIGLLMNRCLLSTTTRTKKVLHHNNLSNINNMNNNNMNNKMKSTIFVSMGSSNRYSSTISSSQQNHHEYININTTNTNTTNNNTNSNNTEDFNMRLENHQKLIINGREIHPIWLRERCILEINAQAGTRQPLHQCHTLPRDLRIEQMDRDPENHDIVHVLFSDGCHSRYNHHLLCRELEDMRSTGIQVDDIKVPDATTQEGYTYAPVRISFHDLFTNDEIANAATNSEVMVKVFENFFKYGHVVLTDVPSYNNVVHDVATAITGFDAVRPSNWGSVFNVKNERDQGRADIAFTNGALPPHVDNPYRDPAPQIQMLSVLVNECSGGDSLAVDGFAVALEMKEKYPEYFQLLCECGVRWENNGGAGDTALYSIAPHIELDSCVDRTTIKQIRYSTKSGGYSPWLPFEKAQKFYEARRCFAEMINEAERATYFRLNTGDIWIFNNLRILHGRSEFVPNNERHLQGLYIDTDGAQTAYFKALYQTRKNNI